MKYLYANIYRSFLFCSFLLVLRYAVVDFYMGSSIDEHLRDIKRTWGAPLLAGVFYGYFCTLVFKRTYLERPNPSYFLMASVVVSVLFFFGYLAFVKGSGLTYYKWGGQIIIEGEPQAVFVVFILMNPFNIMTVIAAFNLLYWKFKLIKPRKNNT